MWEYGNMRMRKWGNEKVRKCCITAFSHFLIFALSYSHILTLHSASLPTGYTQLDKLEFNGGQWIATDCCPAAGDRFECDVTVDAVQSNATAAVFGTVREMAPERTFAFYVRQDGDDSTVVAYGDTARGGFVPRGKKVTLSVGPDGAMWTWEGGFGRLELTPGSARNGMTPLLIGDANAARLDGESVPAGTGAVMALHRFRIWRGGLELLHDYVPCRNSSGEIGLYDHKYDSFLKTKPQPDNVLRDVPYRTWDAERSVMVDCICSNAIPVTADTATFEDGRWYAVTGTVSRGSIRVGGSAHLILCDGAALTANGGDREPGVEVRGENSLHIYGQIGGTGALAANGGRGGSGIGGGDGGGPAGTVTIDGGTVTATGGYYGAGIGGGNQNAGGTVTINGGTVTARGGDSAAGVGGGRDGAGGAVAINGGTVTADRGDRGVDIGGGWFGTGASVTIDGGSVKAMKIKNAPRNVVWGPLYRVAVKCPGLEGLVSLEGLEGYGTNDIHAVEGRVYLWVPSGTHRFTVSGGKAKYHYYAVVREWGVTVEPIPPVGFFVNGKDIGTTVSGDEDKWMYDRSAGKLHLAGFGPYVLSGLATDNEVEVDVEWNGARVVLSNAVVITEWRPALRVAQPAALLMAGGASYLAANGSEAVSVADGPGLVVDLARGADREESEIEVFNSGDEVAIAGKGAVRADGGTFSVWADRQAVETPNAFTCGADEVMMTGWTPEEMRYATACGTEPCIVVGPAVTVTVKDIPHVTGFTVSNAVETITNAARAATCRVMLRDDVYVGYTVEKDFFSLSPNPLAYPTVTSNVVVDADAISIQRAFPYRTWNGTRTVDCVCSNYTVVTADTATFADGRWYVVTNDVRWGTIKVDGSAHLILCDGAKLTANAITNGALTVYGQPSGCGELKVSGTVSTALTCEGGILFAGTLSGGSLAVVGGTLAADDVKDCKATIDGGSVKVGQTDFVSDNFRQTDFVNRAGQPLHRVTAKLSEEGRAGSEEGRAGSEEVRVGRLAIEGLGGYGTNDIYPVEGAVYLWLPNGTHRFTVSDGETTYRYFAIVDGSGITVEPLPPSVPVTPGGSSGPYTTAEDATNAMWAAFICPRDDVAAVLGTDVLLKDYRKMFGFAVTGGGEAWFVEAVLTLTARTNLAATATAATLQIPVAAIARLPDASAIAQQPEIATLAVATSVTVDGCAPGFFYSLYDGRALTNIVADANATNLNVLCGADAKVTFPEVKKPSDAAGFFRVGVRDAPGVTPSDVSHAPITILK